MQLDISQSPSGKQRLLVGLSWEDKPISSPSTRKNIGLNIGATILHAVKYAFRMSQAEKNADNEGRDLNFTQRDLDLLCFVFDDNKKLACVIGPSEKQMAEPTGSIYHSGEEFTGGGVYDDEMIRMEVAKLPSHYRHFFFVVVSDSKLSLGECGTFKLRLADSATEKNFISEAVNAPRDGSSAYIFAKVTRQGNGFEAEAVGKFTDFEGDWEITLPALL